MIEFRTVLEATGPDGGVITFDNPFTDGSDFIRTATIGGAVRDVSSVEPTDYNLVPEADFRQDFEHSYFAWEEVSPALLRRLFVPDDPERTGPFEAVSRHEGVWIKELPASRFSQGSAAHVLHVDLLTGRLERELGEVCADLADQLKAFRIAQDDRIRDAEAAALDRWAVPGGTKSSLEDRNQ